MLFALLLCVGPAPAQRSDDPAVTPAPPGLNGVAAVRNGGDFLPPDGMPVRRVEIEGLQAIGEGYVRSVVKTREGATFSRRQAEEDVRELLRTRKFLSAFAGGRVENAEAIIVFTLQEKPTISAVTIEGNKVFETSELFEITPAAGDVLDRYAVNKARDDILQKYKKEGYYYAEVTLNEPALDEGRVEYRIVEGPRVRVRDIRFEGLQSFSELQLKTKLESTTYIWIFRTGELDEEKVERDTISLQEFYRGEGFLDARVGFRLDFDAVERADLTLAFVIEEGPRYTVKEITIDGNTVFDTERLRGLMTLAPGQFIRNEVLDADVERLRDLYGELGYVECVVATRNDFTEEPAVCIVRYTITEGGASKFGRITIRGNEEVKDEVIRRELRFYPGEEFNTTKTRQAERRVRETGLFSDARITPLQDVEGEREALVEVTENDHVSLLFGVGVSTDNGVIGSVTLENRNFDLFDWPRDTNEFFRGGAFRGDGQRLRIAAEPGTEVSRYRVDFTEPYLFDLPLRYDTSVYYFQRIRDGYDEERLGYINSLSRRFESGLFKGWAIEGALRIEGVGVNDVDTLAAREIREVRGDSFLTAIKLSIVRDTTDSRLFPTEGYRASLSWEQVGALGGDFTFGKPSVGFAWYRTLRTDIFDRKSVLALRADAGYIVGDAPVFERYYAGGFGSVRGFSFRGISPRNGVFDNQVGGDFIFLTGGEYSVPLYGKELRGVVFLDMGTVEDGLGISDWRAAAGVGLRLNLDFFGPVPLVFDFGFPLASNDEDQTQIFNFSVGASF